MLFRSDVTSRVDFAGADDIDTENIGGCSDVKKLNFTSVRVEIDAGILGSGGVSENIIVAADKIVGIAGKGKIAVRGKRGVV